MAKTQDIRLTFSNYNYAFEMFFENYKQTCLDLASKTKISELEDIKSLITTFIFEYDYTFHDEEKKQSYRKEIKHINNSLYLDEDLTKFNYMDLSLIQNKIRYKIKYYQYFLKYLNIFGRFISEMTDTFMPNTNVQKKNLRFSNKQAFFEKFTNHKKQVLHLLSDFKLENFAVVYNNLLTFYYAYSLFINQQDRVIVDRLFSLLISYYLDKKNLNLIFEKQPSKEKRRSQIKLSNTLIEGLLYINSYLNQSFSNYDVLPKIQKKVYQDRTLI